MDYQTDVRLKYQVIATEQFIDPDAGKSILDYWPALPLGRWHLAFTNEGSWPIWVHAAHRYDVFSDFIQVGHVRVSPGRSVIFDLKSLMGGDDWPYLDPRFTYRYLPEYDISMAYLGGEWYVIRPPGSEVATS
jgi:hypothetical protein